MLLYGKKVLLTWKLRGRLGSKESNISSKEIRSKVMNSPFEEAKWDKISHKVVYETPKGHYKDISLYKPYKEQDCTQTCILSEQAVSYYISEEGCPFRFSRFTWNQLSNIDRLKVNLEITAGTKEFSFEIL